jgi:2-dehydro-3-deoxyphosphogluconate aldolase/(4S)-4-hydroxy-2-oxoglutarate aldolase
MDKQTTLQRIKDLGLVAVLRGPSPELTVQMVAALVAGGVKGIEITYSTPNAPQVVHSLASQFGDEIVLGMGTLTRPEQALEAQQASAAFLVSPHCNETLAKAMVQTGLVVMVGALTPTEVFNAYQFGSDIVKVFPGALVGPSYFKSLRGPYPHIPLMPTGGVSVDNVAEWFASGAVAVGAGSELCPPQWAKEGRFDAITRRAREFVAAVQAARAPAT